MFRNWGLAEWGIFSGIVLGLFESVRRFVMWLVKRPKINLQAKNCRYETLGTKTSVSLFCEGGLDSLIDYSRGTYSGSQLYTLTPLILRGFLWMSARLRASIKRI